MAIPIWVPVICNMAKLYERILTFWLFVSLSISECHKEPHFIRNLWHVLERESMSNSICSYLHALELLSDARWHVLKGWCLHLWIITFPLRISLIGNAHIPSCVNVCIYITVKARCCNTTKAVSQDFSGMAFPQLAVMLLWLEMFVHTFTGLHFYRSRAIKGLSGLRFYTLTENRTCLAAFQFNSRCFIGCLSETRATSSKSIWMGFSFKPRTEKYHS